ncbi:hypothetical protein SLA2020_101340 [Shorea laevis]
MVNAVEQEAADKIAQKELELTNLRETMQLYRVRSDENEPLVSYEPKYDSLRQEISSLRQELDAILKYLYNHEVGQLSPHGSLDFDEELSSSKRKIICTAKFQGILFRHQLLLGREMASMKSL